MTGRDRLAAHVPELGQGRGPLIALAASLSFATGTAAMLIVDTWWPQWTALGQIAVVLIGFVWAGQFFWPRPRDWGAFWRFLLHG